MEESVNYSVFISCKMVDLQIDNENVKQHFLDTELDTLPLIKYIQCEAVSRVINMLSTSTHEMVLIWYILCQ